MVQLIVRLQSLLAARQDSERGATMVEYALMVALVAILCIAAVTAMSDGIQAAFNDIASKLAP